MLDPIFSTKPPNRPPPSSPPPWAEVRKTSDRRTEPMRSCIEDLNRDSLARAQWKRGLGFGHSEEEVHRCGNFSKEGKGVVGSVFKMRIIKYIYIY